MENNTACKSEQELLERYACIAMEKQNEFADVIGNNNWNVDMGKGEISFGSDLHFPIQVLGTVSHAAQSWLWAWANTRSGLSETVMQQALQLKTYGEEHGIDLLRNDSFTFSKDDLHLMGMIASGMFNASSYYIADYGQGAMVVTIKSELIDKQRKDTHHTILTTFPQVIARYEMNHKLALKHYLHAKGYAITENGQELSASKNGNTIKATFDGQSRLIELNG
jgi:hypothetical protein